MLANVDIKVVGIIGLLIVLVIGYFTYLLYRDVIFLKKDIDEMRARPLVSDTTLDVENCEDWTSQSEIIDEEYVEMSEEDQDRELDRHIESFMNRKVTVPVLSDIVYLNSKMSLPIVEHDTLIKDNITTTLRIVEPELHVDSLDDIHSRVIELEEHESIINTEPQLIVEEVKQKVRKPRKKKETTIEAVKLEEDHVEDVQVQ